MEGVMAAPPFRVSMMPLYRIFGSTSFNKYPSAPALMELKMFSSLSNTVSITILI